MGEEEQSLLITQNNTRKTMNIHSYANKYGHACYLNPVPDISVITLASVNRRANIINKKFPESKEIFDKKSNVMLLNNLSSSIGSEARDVLSAAHVYCMGVCFVVKWVSCFFI